MEEAGCPGQCAHSVPSSRTQNHAGHYDSVKALPDSPQRSKI
jgi:hypothetical protein